MGTRGKGERFPLDKGTGAPASLYQGKTTKGNSPSKKGASCAQADLVAYGGRKKKDHLREGTPLQGGGEVKKKKKGLLGLILRSIKSKKGT